MKIIQIILIIILEYKISTLEQLNKTRPLLPLKGSYGHQNHGLKQIDSLNPQMNITVTIVTGSWENTQIVELYYMSLSLDIQVQDRTDMYLRMKGNVNQFSQVFNTSFKAYECQSETSQICYASTSEVYIPNHLKNIILGILGLEQVLTLKNSPYLETDSKLKKLKSDSSKSFTGQDAAKLYGFPSPINPTLSRKPINIGIISLCPYFKQSDIDYFFTQMKIDHEPPQINLVFVDGAKFNSSIQYGTNGIVENYLDVDIIASILLPYEANITLFIAPNSPTSLFNAAEKALQQSDVVTLSWAFNESDASLYWKSFPVLLAKYKQVPFFVASGDFGDNLPAGVLFPSSCPNAIACGGTTLNYKRTNTTLSYLNEIGWSDSGGGFSKVFKRPAYQNGVHDNEFRGLPDLSSNGDPNTGFTYCFNNTCNKNAGTSAVAPLYAALTARLMSIHGIESIQNDFKDGSYYRVLSFNDILSGTNGKYKASIGWDPVTGMGTFKAYTPSWYTPTPTQSNIFFISLLTFSVFFACFILIFIVLFICFER